VRIDTEFQLSGELLDLGLDTTRVDDGHAATRITQQVVMVAVVADGVAVITVQMHPREQATPLEQLQSSVHGGAAHPLRSQIGHQALGRDRTVLLSNGSDYRGTRTGQSMAGDSKLAEHALRSGRIG
jgi:hypothetical protein